MCRPVAYIVTKSSVHRCETNSHTDAIIKLGLKDDSRSPDFVRVELLFPELGKDIYDASKYIYTLDQDFLPDWYSAKEVHAACVDDLKKMLSTGNIKIGGDLYLSGLTSLPADAKLSAGGYLDLSGLTSLPADAKLSAGGYLYLRGLKLPASFKQPENWKGNLIR